MNWTPERHAEVKERCEQLKARCEQCEQWTTYVTHIDLPDALAEIERLQAENETLRVALQDAY